MSVVDALIVLAVLFVTGAPAALALSRRRPDLSLLVFEGIAIGLVAQLAIGIIALRTGSFGTTGLAVMTLVVIAAGVAGAIARHRIEWPSVDVPWALITAGLVLAALVLRGRPSYFIFETGDMGEYINRANDVAIGKNLVQSFPHGFIVFLASTHVLLGQARTVAGLPALGIVLLLGVVSFLRAIGTRTAAVIVVAVIVVVHPVTVWFSQFPVSESLYAALFITAAYFFVRARIDRSYGYGVLSGITFGSMLIVRGNAMLLAPLLVVVLVVSAAVDDDVRYRVHRAATIAALAACSIAYAYDVHFPSDYFVHKQLDGLVPGPLFRIGKKAHLFSTSVPMVLAVAAGLVAVVALAEVVRRFVRPRVAEHSTGFVQIASVATLAVGGLAVLALGTHGLRDALERWHIVVVLLVALGTIALVWRPRAYVDLVTGYFLIGSSVTYTVLFVARRAKPIAHPYYLYTDRYLFSEVLVLAFVLAGIGVSAAIGVGLARKWSRRTVQAIAAGAAVVLFVGLVPVAAETHKITQHTMFGEPYPVFRQIDQLTKTGGRKPIVYSGLSKMPPGWFFGDTWRVFASPLEESFHRKMVAIPRRLDAKEPVFDPAGARAALAKAGFSDGYLLALRPAGSSAYPNDAHTKLVRSIDYKIPIIGRKLKPSSEKFHTVDVTLDLYALN